MSGSKAHEADFSVIFTALKAVLKEHHSVRVVSVGYCQYIKNLECLFPDRVEQFDFCDYTTYLSYYQRIDLNVIPLLQNPFNHCKSAIRYLEAGLNNKPTLVSNTGDFRNIIIPGVTGIIVENETATNWYASIVELINNKAFLSDLSNRCYEQVVNEYTVNSISSNVISQMRDLGL